jgi:hypothetical protein
MTCGDLRVIKCPRAWPDHLNIRKEKTGDSNVTNFAGDEAALPGGSTAGTSAGDGA